MCDGREWKKQGHILICYLLFFFILPFCVPGQTPDLTPFSSTLTTTSPPLSPWISITSTPCPSGITLSHIPFLPITRRQLIGFQSQHLGIPCPHKTKPPPFLPPPCYIKIESNFYSSQFSHAIYLILNVYFNVLVCSFFNLNPSFQ